MASLNSEHDLVLKHKQELFGQIPLHTAPERYWELKVIHHLAGGRIEYAEMNMEEQSEAMAFIQLENMKAVLDQNDRIIDRNNQQSAQRAKIEANKKKGRRRRR